MQDAAFLLRTRRGSDAACILAPSGFEHLIAGMPSDFDTSLLAQL
jgi:hypothetical protein